MIEKPKCEDIGFEHLWEDVTPQFAYTCMPPKYPLPERKCINCGLQQIEVVIQEKLTEWRDVNK